jgi:hypothetical protein
MGGTVQAAESVTALVCSKYRKSVWLQLNEHGKVGEVEAEKVQDMLVFYAMSGVTIIDWDTNHCTKRLFDKWHWSNWLFMLNKQDISAMFLQRINSR